MGNKIAVLNIYLRFLDAKFLIIQEKSAVKNTKGSRLRMEGKSKSANPECAMSIVAVKYTLPPEKHKGHKAARSQDNEMKL